MALSNDKPVPVTPVTPPAIPVIPVAPNTFPTALAPAPTTICSIDLSHYNRYYYMLQSTQYGLVKYACVIDIILLSIIGTNFIAKFLTSHFIISNVYIWLAELCGGYSWILHLTIGVFLLISLCIAIAGYSYLANAAVKYDSTSKIIEITKTTKKLNDGCSVSVAYYSSNVGVLGVSNISISNHNAIRFQALMAVLLLIAHSAILIALVGFTIFAVFKLI
jgi:hypothetical protein